MAVLLAFSYLWALPLVLIGLLLALLYVPLEARVRKGIVEIRVRRIVFGYATTVGQTWGWLVLYKVPSFADLPERLVVHEGAHVLQGRILGPLFILAYPIASFVAWARGGHIYRDNWFEIQAQKAASATRISTIGS
jgi:hypothetical protein